MGDSFNAARGVYGYGCSLTRPVTYRSETVGVAERVLCPVRCVANAFSCVLSGCWQLPWHQAFDRTPMNGTASYRRVLAIVIVYKLWPFIFVQYAAFFSGSAPQNSVTLTNCDIISTSYEVNLSIIFVSDYNIFEIRWGNPSNEEEIF